MKNNKKILLITSVMALFIGFNLMSTDADAADKEKVVPKNISIAGTDVSGMTKEEADKVISDYVKAYDGVKFTFTVADKGVTANREDIGLRTKNADVVDQALSYGKKGNLISRYKAKTDMKNGVKKDFNLSLTIDAATLEGYLNVHKDELVQEAKDNTVKLVDGKFEYVEGQAGEALMVEQAAVNMADFVCSEWDGKDAEIELPTKKDTPRGTKEELSTIKDVLGECSTNFGLAVDGRTKNINVAAGFLDGKVIYPGEVVSVAETIGPTTAEKGYFPAGSYENGTTVETYGGGVCQVSSTLYNAVLGAELEIVTRAAHSMVVGYVEPSKDAAIADGAKDFQFKNNQETPIYIQGYTSGGYLYFRIYGKEVRPETRKVEYISEVTSQTDPEKEYVAAGDQPIGYVETTTKPHIGYTARLWKVVYENGAEVSRKVINNSKYAPSKEVISVGIATGNGEAQAAVVAAIAAANEAQNADALMGVVGTWTDEAIAARAQASQPTVAPVEPPKTETPKPEDSTKPQTPPAGAESTVPTA